MEEEALPSPSQTTGRTQTERDIWATLGILACSDKMNAVNGRKEEEGRGTGCLSTEEQFPALERATHDIISGLCFGVEFNCMEGSKEMGRMNVT